MTPKPPSTLLVHVVGVHPIDEPSWFLVEVILSGVSGPVDFARFTQPDPDVKESLWQVAYDERLLSADGTRQIAELTSKEEDVSVWHGAMRCAFFFFDLRPTLPFRGPTGEIHLPPISALPDRLRFVEFVPP